MTADCIPWENDNSQVVFNGRKCWGTKGILWLRCGGGVRSECCENWRACRGQACISLRSDTWHTNDFVFIDEEMDTKIKNWWFDTNLHTLMLWFKTVSCIEMLQFYDTPSKPKPLSFMDSVTLLVRLSVKVAASWLSNILCECLLHKSRRNWSNLKSDLAYFLHS